MGSTCFVVGQLKQPIEIELGLQTSIVVKLELRIWLHCDFQNDQGCIMRKTNENLY